MSDAWQSGNISINEVAVETGANILDNHMVFEDDFAPQTDKPFDTLENKKIDTTQHKNHQPLPDSLLYVKCLERKLQAIHKDCKLVDALADKRQSSLRILLNEEDREQTPSEQHLDTPIINCESSTGSLYRHIRPIQPLSQGETVHLVKYDQLEQQMQK